MERHAVIIECSAIPGQDRLPGCALDAAAWKDYLCSAAGGAWYNSEIEVLSNPSAKAALACTQKIYAGYGFVAFSGHGYVDMSTGQTMACFVGGNLSDSQLAPPSDRATLIMDSCRGLAHVAIAKESMELREAVIDKQAYRDLFDRALERAEKGSCRIYGCSFDEAANEEKTGGAFTQNLIKVGTAWRTSGVLTLRQSFDAATARVRQRYPQQNPEALLGRRLNHFPFAVHP